MEVKIKHEGEEETITVRDYWCEDEISLKSDGLLYIREDVDDAVTITSRPLHFSITTASTMTADIIGFPMYIGIQHPGIKASDDWEDQSGLYPIKKYPISVRVEQLKPTVSGGEKYFVIPFEVVALMDGLLTGYALIDIQAGTKPVLLAHVDVSGENPCAACSCGTTVWIMSGYAQVYHGKIKTIFTSREQCCCGLPGTYKYGYYTVIPESAVGNHFYVGSSGCWNEYASPVAGPVYMGFKTGVRYGDEYTYYGTNNAVPLHRFVIHNAATVRRLISLHRLAWGIKDNELRATDLLPTSFEFWVRPRNSHPRAMASIFCLTETPWVSVAPLMDTNVPDYDDYKYIDVINARSINPVTYPAGIEHRSWLNLYLQPGTIQLIYGDKYCIGVQAALPVMQWTHVILQAESYDFDTSLNPEQLSWCLYLNGVKSGFGAGATPTAVARRFSYSQSAFSQSLAECGTANAEFDLECLRIGYNIRDSRWPALTYNNLANAQNDTFVVVAQQ